MKLKILFSEIRDNIRNLEFCIKIRSKIEHKKLLLFLLFQILREMQNMIKLSKLNIVIFIGHNDSNKEAMDNKAFEAEEDEKETV